MRVGVNLRPSCICVCVCGCEKKEKECVSLKCVNGSVCVRVHVFVLASESSTGDWGMGCKTQGGGWEDEVVGQHY